mgnify:CR=1 FL=1
MRTCQAGSSVPARGGIRMVSSLLRTRGPARRQGFSLLELIIVLVIISLVLALVLPRVGRLPRGLRERRALSRIEQAFRGAAMRARTTGQAASLILDPDANALRIDSVPASDPLSAANLLLEENVDANDEPPDESPLAPAMAVAMPDGTAWFLGDGALPGAERPRFRFFPDGSATGPTLKVQVARREFRVTVDRLTGRALINPTGIPPSL